VVHVELFVEYCTTQSVIDAAVAALAVHDKGTCVFPTVPTVSVGAPGDTPGTEVTEGEEYAPVPTAFIAATLK
jgi:hypothetical protein